MWKTIFFGFVEVRVYSFKFFEKYDRIWCIMMKLLSLQEDCCAIYYMVGF